LGEWIICEKFRLDVKNPTNSLFEAGFPGKTAENARQIRGFPNGELLKTYCVGEFRACGARRTLGTCPVFAKPVGTNFARSRRFREVPNLLLGARQFCLLLTST
jgi:hypothetical protein